MKEQRKGKETKEKGHNQDQEKVVETMVKVGEKGVVHHQVPHLTPRSSVTKTGFHSEKRSTFFLKA